MQEKKIKNNSEGYQPLKRGYQASRSPQDKNPPKGGTGLASINSDKKNDNRQTTNE